MTFKKLDEIYNLLKNEEYNKVENNYEKEYIDCVLRLRNFKENKDNIKLKLIKCRDNQKKFRNDLVKKFNKCPISKLDENICEAAHIVPFSVSNNNQKYDLYNGILLSANLHKAFDKFYFTIDENTCKTVINYNLINKNNIKLEELGLHNKENIYIRELDNEKSKYYLKIHNENINLKLI